MGEPMSGSVKSEMDLRLPDTCLLRPYVFSTSACFCWAAAAAANICCIEFFLILSVLVLE